jgi:FkbM family methyltransferase
VSEPLETAAARPSAPATYSPLYVRFLEVGNELSVTTRSEFLSDELRERWVTTVQRDEALEWRGLLDAVSDAERQFTMFELGAGYGRWSIRAAAAVRLYRPDLRYRLVAVEPEPTHVRWLAQHARDNGLRRWSRRGTFRIVAAAASGETERMQPFFAGNPSAWYGQTLVRPENSGWQGPSMSVRTVRLSELLRLRGLVDLVDLDIQGLELEVLLEARRALAKVRRIYVETHSAHIDASLEEMFAAAAGSWTCVASAAIGEEAVTPLGPTRFSMGGAQLWQNLALF